jgi:LacI family transcriptional regulator
VAILFCDSRDDPEREARQVQALLRRPVDGIVVNGRRTEPRDRLADTGGIPVAPTPGTTVVPATLVVRESA